ncbi:hypothetical protein Ctaglu_20060 [Clostridium tagluense]|uniref:Uncharacterized protein n=1 Tax=Clostridium tagluense TaxID=360422 RepID=A0A401ULI0_9CLOT|nr:hypothetical protein Ctaglu_20060 [Clostridium tagluense]
MRLKLWEHLYCIKIQFLNKGGKLIQQKQLDYDMEMYAGVHPTFLNKLLRDKNDLIKIYLKVKEEK